MKNLFALIGMILVSTLCPVTGLAQGVVSEGLRVESKILGKNIAYSIYLPEDYNDSNRRYPVLYLLHGYTDEENAWIQFGRVKTIADRSFKSTDVSPMIIVMPDAGFTWYINSADGKVRYEDFFIQELIPFIDKTYRTRPKKEFRAISGLSMGGYGTLVYSLKYPDLFGAAAPLSAAISTNKEWIAKEQRRWDRVFGEVFGKGMTGEERLSDHYLQNAPLNMVRNADPEELKSVRFYIDCGDKDRLITGNMQLHALLIDRGVPHEFRVRDGAHEWSYWRSALPEVLKFVSQRFQR